MFKLHLFSVFAENGGAGKPLLIFREVGPVNNVDLLCLLRFFLCDSRRSEENDKEISNVFKQVSKFCPKIGYFKGGCYALG